MEELNQFEVKKGVLVTGETLKGGRKGCPVSQNDRNGMHLTQVMMVLAVVFSVHIALGAAVFGVFAVLFTLCERYKALCWPVLAGIAVVGVLAVLGIPEPPDGMSVPRMLYFGSLDSLTGFLKDALGVRGSLAFRLARFFVRLLPVSAGTAVFLAGWFLLKKYRGGVTTGPKPLFRRRLSHRRSEKLRHNGNGAFIGVNTAGKPVYLTDYERGMHMQVVGSTGFGKTASVLMPLLASDLKRGKSVIFIDGKGDCPSLASFISMVREAGREHDTYIFAPSYPNISNSWNPLASGNPVVRKDRIVGAQIWSEEFYKKKGEDLLQSVLHIFDDLQITPSFPLLAEFLKNPDADFIKGRRFRSPKVEDDYKAVKASLKNEARIYAGIISDINLFAESFLKPMLTAGRPDEFHLYDVAMKGKVVYFSLPVLMMEETMKRLARMVIHDLKTVASVIESYDDDRKRRAISVFIDEFGSFADKSFIELLNKARSSGMAIAMIHQSLGDIDGVDKNFARQINENTNIKIALRIDDPATIEQLCRMAGTHEEKKYTYQTNMGIFGANSSGAASMREVEAFNIDPNIFRRLGVGEAVLMKKTGPNNRLEFHTVRFDHIDPPKVDLTPYAKEAREIVIDGTHQNESPKVDVENKPVGNTVILDHGNGFESLYGHAEDILVSAGDAVKKGQLIASMGSTGVSTGEHLHFEVRFAGEAVDPAVFVK